MKQIGIPPKIASEVNKKVNDSVDKSNTHLGRAIESPVTEGANYCSECGEEIIFCCESCGEAILVNEGWDSDFNDLPSFCKNCGSNYPWVNPTTEKEQRDDNFLEIEDKNVNGQFYPSLIYEINQCYQIKADEATLVLTRKLVENLLIDALRGHFGMENNEMFYKKDRGEFKGLDNLLESFENNLPEFEEYITVDGKNILDKAHSLRHTANASAHSIENQVEKEELDSLSQDATYVTKILLRLRREIQTAHRD